MLRRCQVPQHEPGWARHHDPDGERHQRPEVLTSCQDDNHDDGRGRNRPFSNRSNEERAQPLLLVPDLYGNPAAGWFRVKWSKNTPTDNPDPIPAWLEGNGLNPGILVTHPRWLLLP